jgi:hypothetical protein
LVHEPSGGNKQLALPFACSILSKVGYTQNWHHPQPIVDTSGLSQSNHYHGLRLLLRSPEPTLARSTAVFGIHSIALLHPQ